MFVCLYVTVAVFFIVHGREPIRPVPVVASEYTLLKNVIERKKESLIARPRLRGWGTKWDPTKNAVEVVLKRSCSLRECAVVRIQVL